MTPQSASTAYELSDPPARSQHARRTSTVPTSADEDRNNICALSKEAVLAPRNPRSDALAQQLSLQRAFGQPNGGRDEMPMLLLEGIHDRSIDLFSEAGLTNISRLKEALEGDALEKQISKISLLGIRSRTQLAAHAIAAADELLAIGCFSVGTNQVDLEAARLRGVPVFNAPFSNTRSVAELVIGEIVMLVRQVFGRSMAAHSGKWQKSATGSHEVRGKTLGIVGYGNIGSQLSHLAEAMGMKVIYFDIVDKLALGNAERTGSLVELLERSDIVSLHVPETHATSHMIGKRELAAMRNGACLINNCRGTVVDLESLAEELRCGRLAGAAVDVFPVEPSSSSDALITPLRGLANVILTPHIGGSTEEAQERIGEEVACKLIEFTRLGSTAGAVNFPELQLPRRSAGVRFTQVGRDVRDIGAGLIEIFSRHNVAIDAFHQATDGEISYAAIDVQGLGARAAVIHRELNRLDGSIRTRMICLNPSYYDEAHNRLG